MSRKKRHDVGDGLAAGLDLRHTGYDVVEEKVRDLVRVFNRYGYKTVCSCSGHVAHHEPVPWIVILVDKEDPLQLLRLVEAVARFNLSKGKNGHLPLSRDTWVISPQDTQEGGLTVYLRPQGLNEERDQKEIDRLCCIGLQLADFMEKQCRDIFPI